MRKRAASVPARLQLTLSVAVKVVTGSVFSGIAVALVAAPWPPEGPVICGATGSGGGTATVSTRLTELLLALPSLSWKLIVRGAVDGLPAMLS